MKRYSIAALAAALLLVSASPLPAVAADKTADKTVVISESQLKWKDMGIPGVMSAVVSGDMEKGPSRFFLKYPVGFVTPPHHHSTDHYATLVSGHVTLTVDGKANKLGPGSYFALIGKAPHVAKVEGNEPAVFFIEALGPWDVVMEKK